MSEARSRTLTGAWVEGYRITRRRVDDWAEQSKSTKRYRSLYQTMNDIVGNPLEDNPANSSKYTRRGGLANGLNYYGSSDQFLHEYIDFPYLVGLGTAIWSPSHLPLEGVPGVIEAAVTGAARGNPSRPSVQLPVSIAEIREIPRMILSKLPRGLNALRDIPDAAADGYLTYSFGVAPVVSDIKKLFTLPTLIESRISTLNLLKRTKRIRRQRTIWDETQVDVGPVENLQVFQTGGYLKGRKITETRGTCLVTSRWEASDQIQHIDESRMPALARNLVLGLEPQTLITNAWELLPWSWLIDYFSNLGDFLSLSNNVVARPSGPCCVTYYTSTTGRTELTSLNSDVVCSPYIFRRKDWVRHISLPVLPSFTAPFLTGHQTSILGSLAIKFRS